MIIGFANVNFGIRKHVNVVQPDLLYVSGKQKEIVKELRIDGPPTLVVEILSPSTSHRDRLQKLRIYQGTKVQHYWIVNPDEKTIECFSLRDGLYALVAAGMDDNVVEHPSFTGLSIVLKTISSYNSQYMLPHVTSANTSLGDAFQFN